MSSLPPVATDTFPAGKIFLSAVYFWLVMVAYYILKPVRDSLFLGESGIRDLPLAHLLNLGATLLFVQAYVALSRRLNRRWFVIGVNFSFIAAMLLFWLLLGPMGMGAEARKPLAWVYFVFVSAFSIFGVSLLWSLTHSTFTPEEGQKYYGWIGSGGTLGALSGGWLTSTLVKSVGTTNLLLIAAIGFLPGLFIGSALGQKADEKAARDAEQESATAKATADRSPGSLPPSEATGLSGIIHLLLRNRYLGLIALLVFTKLFVGLTQDYQTQEFISRAFSKDQDSRTQFFGSVYQWTNALGLLLGLVVTGPVQTRWGALPGLTTYPVAAFLGGMSLLFWPNLTTVFLMAVVTQACAYSIFQWSQELLYQRTTKEEKFVAKGFIDSFVFRLGTGAAALSILGIGKLGDHGYLNASGVVMGTLLVSSIVLLLIAITLGRQFQILGGHQEKPQSTSTP